MKEFNLSKKKAISSDFMIATPVIKLEDVKEFIRIVEEDIPKEFLGRDEIIDIINKRAGDDLK